MTTPPAEESSIPAEQSTALTRRRFLETTAIAGAASALPIAASAQVAGSDAIKISLIGCGGRGSGAANQALNNDGIRLVAMADAFKDRLEGSLNSLRQSHADKIDVPEARRYVGFDGYKQAMADADLVILTTPPGFRPIHFEEAVRNNKHVFMEKPVAVDSPGVRRVLAAAKEADAKGLKVVVGLQRHYQNSYLAAMEQVKEQDAIGSIISGQVYWNSSGVWVNERRPGMTEMEYQMRNWYYFNWLCGDHIVEQHIHNIDVFNWFKGAHPVLARGMGGREVRDADPKFGEIFDHHYVEYLYEDGTVLNSQCRHIHNCWNDVSETIVGTKGVLDFRRGAIRGHDGSEIWRYRSRENPDPYQVEHDVLQRHVREDKPINDAYHGAESTFTAIIGRYATYSGKEIRWDEALAAENSLLPDSFAWDATPKVVPGPDGQYPIAVPGQFDPFKA